MLLTSCYCKLPIIKSISNLGSLKIYESNAFRVIQYNANRTGRRYKSTADKSVVKSSADGQVSTNIGEKVKQTTKDVYYSGIIVAGVLITGALGYTIFRELFSSESPNGVYTKAFKLCKQDHRVIDAIGEPIKGYGETTGRGRRRHVSQATFEQDGVQCMRMRFYIQGSRQKGTVHLEVRKGSNGKYDYRYLFVELDNYIRETIIIEDNR